MRLNTLPDVLFPNPIQHPNYKISFLDKVREDILNNQLLNEPMRRSRQNMTIRSQQRGSIRIISPSIVTSQNNTQTNFRSGSSKFKVIKEHSQMEEMDETFSRTRTPSQLVKRLKRGLSMFEKQL
ncbi:unnamed protein product [Paramecium pentaurelia]|uniref:Uncharacterized protein n=1 Tax=Paramecium pentaurelia TaxID=43138 RepID=A0A8S1XV15_9CILI|nr:unnamed protein product [Paramecium pentaurelia]